MTDLSADPAVPAVLAGGGDDATRIQPRSDAAATHVRSPEAASRVDGEVALLPVTPDDYDESHRSSDEARALAAERAARRAARERALAAPDSAVVPPPPPTVVTRRSTDRFAGALGLFLLRQVVALIMVVHGLEFVTDPAAAEALFARTALPAPGILSQVTGVCELAIAAALVFGLLVRAAGVGVSLIAAGALAFVEWGSWSPFVPGRPGFLGELELLLAGAGLLFVFVGGGGFGLDRAFRAARERGRSTRAAAVR